MHGVAHLAGCTSLLTGTFASRLPWLLLGLAFIANAAGAAFRASWWLVSLECLVLVSTLFCIVWWRDAKLGVAANLLVFVVAFVAIRFPGREMPLRDMALEKLWNFAPSAAGGSLRNPPASLPDPARRFLAHAIAPGAPSVTAVRLKMRGEIRLGRWVPFRAEEVLTRDGSFIWAAVVSAMGLPVRGSDTLVNGTGAMKWKLFDLFPIAAAAGPDVARSGTGRLHGELAAWLPASLPLTPAAWAEPRPGELQVRVESGQEPTHVILIADGGRLKQVKFRRWGNPDGGAFGYGTFGVMVDEEQTFGAFTIPSRVRAGWFSSDAQDHFSESGEFFHATIDSAEFK